jgi:hypothetical protein
MRRNILVGKILTGVTLSGNQESIVFHTTEADYYVEVEAECCSYTWIEHIELPALGFPALVIAVEELDLPTGNESSFHPDTDFVQFYGCKITTDRGEIVIDYRNDSNGYYGGNLKWP